MSPGVMQTGQHNATSFPSGAMRMTAPKAETRPLLDHFEFPAFPGESHGEGEWSGGAPGVVAGWEVAGYSVVVPSFCAVGLVANALSLLVLVRGAARLKESLYTYLKVLSAADLVTVTLVLLSGLARGVWRDSFSWRCFDAFVHLPVGSISTTVSIATLVVVTVERVAVIRAPVAARSFYCTPTRARSTSVGVLFFAVVFNVPYCLTYAVRDGRIAYGEFAASRYYAIHNWLRLVVLGLLPGVTLLLGNLLLLHSLRQPRSSLLARPRNPNVHNAHA
ncbi:uncharacterized protein LOC122262111 [Penaeus japonicus]|uniref:uncharacterized protein LOC122262111 n=1 Tax=Penaeus japonicus TaxID=27405 RepID=UPI001C713E82|nr:uncharacterized protein LOC122262111 [Penaeus japonicus]